MEIPELAHITFTPSEAELLENWIRTRDRNLTAKLRAARLAFALENGYAFTDETQVDMTKADRIPSDTRTSQLSPDRQRAIREELAIDRAANATKDAHGAERHVIGPVSLNAQELIDCLAVGYQARTAAQEDRVLIDAELAILPGVNLSGRVQAERQFMEVQAIPEAEHNIQVANGIVAAIGDYLSTLKES